MTDPAVEAATRAVPYAYEADEVIADISVNAAREALKPLRELHKPLTIMCLAANCGAEVCDHEDDCPTDTPIVVCGECWQIVELASSYYGEEGIDSGLLWPCHTAKLIYTTEEI